MNPFLPLDICIPDGEPRVFGNRIYLYGSCDVAGEMSYCSSNHYVFSASVDDLEHWTNHGLAFSSAGPNAEVPWAEGVLYAPDAIEKDGSYYMFFNLSDGSEGVAMSDSPTGPFINAKRIYYPKSIENGGPLHNIDPSIFIDDDGKMYYYWGQFNAQAAQIKENMHELVEGTYHPAVLTEAEHFFHEGSSMRKIGDIYYFIYCETSTGRANNLGYATSKSPFGPFIYQGVIINNAEADPESWNNHGSIVKIKDQWYIFYHRSSNNSVYSRRACAEPIYFDETGRIKQVEMTTQGFSPSPEACHRMPGYRACFVKGGNYITIGENGSGLLVKNKNGACAGFKYLDFGNQDITTPAGEPKKMIFEAKIRPIAQRGEIEIILDTLAEPPVGKITFEKQEKEWIYVSASIKEITGKHAVYLRFTGDDSEESLCDFNWFVFK